MSNKTDRRFECPRCKQTWIETDKRVIKCICPKDNIEMIKVEGDKDEK